MISIFILEMYQEHAILDCILSTALLSNAVYCPCNPLRFSFCESHIYYCYSWTDLERITVRIPLSGFGDYSPELCVHVTLHILIREEPNRR